MLRHKAQVSSQLGGAGGLAQILCSWHSAWRIAWSPPGLAVSLLLAREMQRKCREGCDHLFSQDVTYLLHIFLQMLKLSQVFSQIARHKTFVFTLHHT